MLTYLKVFRHEVSSLAMHYVYLSCIFLTRLAWGQKGRVNFGGLLVL